jgi:hypothetical protein
MKALHLEKQTSLSKTYDAIINSTVKENQEKVIKGITKSFYSFSFSTKVFRKRILREYNYLLRK